MNPIQQTAIMKALLVEGLPDKAPGYIRDTWTGLRYRWSGALRGWYCQGTGKVIRVDQYEFWQKETERFQPVPETRKMPVKHACECSVSLPNKLNINQGAGWN